MGEDRIKSALEIAMEKAAAIPELTPEEIDEQREREYKPRGMAIANKYLENILKGNELEIELHRYQRKEGEVVRKALLATLSQSISLEDMDSSLRAIDGIEMVETGVDLEEAKREMESIFNESAELRIQKGSVYEELERDKLRGRWISGSAVRPNVEGNEDWQQELREIKSAYDSRISRLREKLLHSAGVY